MTLIEDRSVELEDRIQQTMFAILATNLNSESAKHLGEKFEPDYIIDKECEQLVRYLTSCDVGIFMLNFLEILRRVLYTGDNSLFGIN